MNKKSILDHSCSQNVLGLASCESLDEMAALMAAGELCAYQVRRARGAGKAFWLAFVAKYPETRKAFEKGEEYMSDHKKIFTPKVSLKQTNCFIQSRDSQIKEIKVSLEGKLTMQEAKKVLNKMLRFEFSLLKVTYRNL